jgi:hypothetical protein
LNGKPSLKLIKSAILWVLALQLLNMSICSEAYWYYYNDNLPASSSDINADPTETIVEWLVEMKMGQQDAFTYDHNATDSRNTVKAIAFHIDLQNQTNDLSILKKCSPVSYPIVVASVESIDLEIFTPPPDSALTQI